MVYHIVLLRAKLDLFSIEDRKQFSFYVEILY
jgi:hypothetical protein